MLSFQLCSNLKGCFFTHMMKASCCPILARKKSKTTISKNVKYRILTGVSKKLCNGILLES